MSRFTPRTLAIAAYLREHPTETYRSVAVRFAVSYQYIQQIAKRDGQPSRPRGVHRLYGSGKYGMRTCTGCGAVIRAQTPNEPPTYTCFPCRRVAVITPTCGRCGETYTIPAGERAYTFRLNRRRYPDSVPECPQCWRHYGGRPGSRGKKEEASA